ncbi:peptide cleavage/export ABC transporter [Fructobacillus durionis]|uniref:ATP-binding cassette, subfamily C, competence factor transporting protein n=1 Tax=Fructobacillus durionis TaxID=283737 RepID=A0A1I1F3P1_9LACO|nr:peptide cleavage/export ABC transporter [Fructobacillus durionis]SFB93877.1 ATP-binding cassette, subfamily C, competence factor transporting protein [Fructobacillus durionis]
MFFKYISQVDERDCGVACLAMVLKSYKHIVSIARLRELAKTNLEGTTALGIKRAAEKENFTVQAVQANMTLFDEYKKLPLPFIIHVQKPDKGQIVEHYYVIYKVGHNRIYIADPDPNVKKMAMSYVEISKQWTGVALFFAPNPEFSPEKMHDSYLSSIFSIMKKYKGLIVNTVIAALFVTLVGVVGSYFVQLLVDEYVPNSMTSTLTIVSCGLIIAYSFQQIMSYTEQYLLIVIGQRLSIDLILSYIKHLFQLPMSFFYNRRIGELTSRFNDANSVIEAIASSILSLLIDVIVVLMMAIILLNYNAQLFLITILSIPIYCIIIMLFVKKFSRLNHEVMSAGANLEASIIERLKGMETVKALGAEQKSYGSIDHDYVVFLTKSFLKEKAIAIQEAVKGLIKLMLQVIILWVGAQLVIKGEMTIGKLMAYNALLSYFTDPLQSIINLQSKIQMAMVAAHRLQEVYEVQSEFQLNDESFTLSAEKIEIEFKSLSFGYQYNHSIFNHLDLLIKANQKVALVGSTGSGKSTLVKLLIRFFEVENGSGEIRINGHNIKHVNKESLRSIISYVPQESQFFSGKIIDNLLLGVESEIDINDVFKACEMVEIRADIEAMPNGFFTELSDTTTLSGGQKQRLAIARVLLRNSKVLILDESTSNLDRLTEKKVISRLMAIQDKTIIFVAHRLTIAEYAERVVMLEKGNVVADGSHGLLLKSNKHYQTLVQK